MSSVSLNKITLGMMGLGHMGGAVLQGLMGKHIKPQQVWAISSSAASAEKKTDEWGVRCFTPSAYAAELAKTNVLILAVKPHQVKAALTDLKRMLASQPLNTSLVLVSMVAGVSIEELHALTEGLHLPIVRVMPNLAAAVRESVTGMTYGPSVQLHHKELLEALFSTIGSVSVVEEKHLPALTALAGGPAFVALAAEGLAEGLLARGIPAVQAQAMVAQLLVGTGRLLQESGRSPASLKACVTTPAGTTVEGLRVLEREAVRSAFAEAVIASVLKAGG